MSRQGRKKLESTSSYSCPSTQEKGKSYKAFIPCFDAICFLLCRQRFELSLLDCVYLLKLFPCSLVLFCFFTSSNSPTREEESRIIKTFNSIKDVSASKLLITDDACDTSRIESKFKHLDVWKVMSPSLQKHDYSVVEVSIRQYIFFLRFLLYGEGEKKVGIGGLASLHSLIHLMSMSSGVRFDRVYWPCLRTQCIPLISWTRSCPSNTPTTRAHKPRPAKTPHGDYCPTRISRQSLKGLGAVAQII